MAKLPRRPSSLLVVELLDQFLDWVKLNLDCYDRYLRLFQNFKEHANVARELEDRLTIEKPVHLLVADVSSAIDRATDFDKRMMNRNFDVDWQAYPHVQKGLSQLVKLGLLADAQSLALKLMKDGSYQVECSVEGLMAGEIIQCLKPVICAVKAAGGEEAIEWAGDMQTADRVGFIRDKELAALRGGSRANTKTWSAIFFPARDC